MKEDLFEELLKKYKSKFEEAIKKDYFQGGMITIDNLDMSGSPVSLTKKQLNANVNVINSLVKGVNLEISKKINVTINENIANNGSNLDLAKKLKALFDEESPNYFNYKNRFQTIAKTEGSRILNLGARNTAVRLGAKKKYLVGVNDKKQGEDSKIVLDKYGTPDKAIPIDEPFEYTYRGKKYSYLLPPARPNDREIPIYVFD